MQLCDDQNGTLSEEEEAALDEDKAELSTRRSAVCVPPNVQTGLVTSLMRQMNPQMLGNLHDTPLKPPEC